MSSAMQQTRKRQLQALTVVTTTAEEEEASSLQIPSSKSKRGKTGSVKSNPRRVNFSPKTETFLAADYDRTPPELDVFDCDGCTVKILRDRYHCMKCDYDLCDVCAPTLMRKHKHGKRSFERIPADNDDDDEEEQEN